MRGNGIATAIGSLSLILVLGGCVAARPAPSNGATFAAAGIAYADAVTELIEESFTLAVEANSIQLALARDSLTEQERSERLALADRQLQRRRQLLDDVQAHAEVLRDYFTALGTLLASGGGEAIEAALTAQLSRLPGLQEAIAAREINGVGLGSLLAPAAAMTVGHHRNAALQRELVKRGVVIERELALQQAVIQALVGQMRDDAHFIATIRDVNPVYEDYVSARRLPARWPQQRVKKFTQLSRLKSLDKLNQAADEMRAAWIALVENEAAAGGWNLFLQDIEHLLSVLET
ncbi:MAG: hypothetical protein PVF89_01815 [Lysobacterales bacterium]